MRGFSFTVVVATLFVMGCRSTPRDSSSHPEVKARHDVLRIALEVLDSKTRCWINGRSAGVMPDSVVPGAALLTKPPNESPGLEDENEDAIPRSSARIKSLRSHVNPDEVVVKIVVGQGVKSAPVHMMIDICRSHGFIHFTIAKPDDSEFGWRRGAGDG